MNIKGALQFFSMVRKCCWTVVEALENMRTKQYNTAHDLEFTINSQRQLEIVRSPLDTWCCKPRWLCHKPKFKGPWLIWALWAASVVNAATARSHYMPIHALAITLKEGLVFEEKKVQMHAFSCPLVIHPTPTKFSVHSLRWCERREKKLRVCNKSLKPHSYRRWHSKAGFPKWRVCEPVQTACLLCLAPRQRRWASRDF